MVIVDTVKDLAAYDVDWIKKLRDKKVKIKKAMVDPDTGKTRQEKAKVPKGLKKVKATGAKRPGYVRGTSKQQLKFIAAMATLRRGVRARLAAQLRALKPASAAEVAKIMQPIFVEWQALVYAQATPAIVEMYVAGMKSGALEMGVKFDPKAGDVNAVKWMVSQQEGIVPSLQNFTDKERAHVEEIVHRAFEPGDQLFDLDAMTKAIAVEAPKEKWRLERIARTETSKIMGLRRMAAWKVDENNMRYHYHYVATHDEKVRPDHLRREGGGPYTLDQLEKVWIQREPYNCRCSLVRTLKTKEELIDEKLVSPEEQELLWDARVFEPTVVTEGASRREA